MNRRKVNKQYFGYSICIFLDLIIASTIWLVIEKFTLSPNYKTVIKCIKYRFQCLEQINYSVFLAPTEALKFKSPSVSVRLKVQLSLFFFSMGQKPLTVFLEHSKSCSSETLRASTKKKRAKVREHLSECMLIRVIREHSYQVKQLELLNTSSCFS